MIQLLKTIFGFSRPERITRKQIDQLSPVRLCRQFIDGELVSDTECKILDIIMYAVELHAEVHNGGFNQYYYNSRGDRCECALNTFILLGDDRTADVVKRANGYFIANRNRLHAAWEDGTKKSFCIGYKEKLFDAFDKEYYTLMNSDNQLYELIGTYIKHHPQEFLSEEETRQRYDNSE